jgi:hypothetical protein
MAIIGDLKSNKDLQYLRRYLRRMRELLAYREFTMYILGDRPDLRLIAWARIGSRDFILDGTF